MRTIIKNAAIEDGTFTPNSTGFDCMIINDSKIEYLGYTTDPKVSSLLGQPGDVTVQDAGGRSILPSFTDGHMHLLLFGSSLLKVDLNQCSNLEEIRETISDAAKKQPEASSIKCKNWRHESTDGKALASMIDGIDGVGDRPIFIDASDLHSVWCNTAALKELDLDDTPDPVGGKIHRDENGKPSGLLSESAAITIVWPYYMKTSSKEEKTEWIRAAARTYNAAGYSGAIEMATDRGIWDVVQPLYETEGLSLRLAVHWLILPSSTDEENLAQVDQAVALHKQYNLTSSPMFRIAGIKVITDGVIDACTAALSEPYCSNGSHCSALWTASALERVVHRASSAGLQCALHAIGDAAVSLAVNALSSLGPSGFGQRHRIEHLELTHPEDARRLGEQGITASIQPVHSDPAILRAWNSLLGPERRRRAFAYREFHDHGAHLAIGTDSPTASHLPFRNLYTAITRRSAQEPEYTETVNEHFKLKLEDALRGMSLGTAYSCFTEGLTGSLEVGKCADFIVVNKGGDWKARPEVLFQATVDETWLDGKKVFKRVVE